MSKRAIAWLALLASTSLQAASLHVKSGETHVLPAQRQWVLTELRLEDNATLVIPAVAGPIQIDAVRAEFGKGARILAAGTNGQAGRNGAGLSAAAAVCEDGADGEHGQPGGAGGDGASLSLTLQLARLDSLLIDVSGGAGGAGGAGGQGQDAGAAENCNPPRGGRGGHGGGGGKGGDAGHVTLFYGLLPGAPAPQAVLERIEVRAAAGSGGNGGAAGKGGAGAGGKYVTRKSLGGNKTWVAGGAAGADGQPGPRGADGSKGQVLIQQDLRNRMDQLVQAPVQPQRQVAPTNLDQRVEQLEEALRSVMQRLQQLEAKLDKN